MKTSDQEMIRLIASLWIELGGDADGINWSWQKIRNEVERQIKGEDS